VQLNDQDYAQFTMRFENREIHELACRLQDDNEFYLNFQAFVTTLQLSVADGNRIIKEYNGIKPPTYNALHRLIATWVARNGSKATLDVLAASFRRFELQSSAAIIEQFMVGKKKDASKRQIEMADIHDIAIRVSADSALQNAFVKLMGSFEIGASDEASILYDFNGREPSTPFYNLVSQSIRTWVSRQRPSDCTWAALLRVMVKSNIATGVEIVIKYFKECLVSKKI